MKKIIVDIKEFKTVLEKLKAKLVYYSSEKIYFHDCFDTVEIYYHSPIASEHSPNFVTTEPINFSLKDLESI